MAIVVEEQVKSRSYTEETDSETLERIFMVKGTDDPYLARPYGPQKGDEYGAGLVVVGRKLEVSKIKDGSNDGAVKLVVTYKTPESANPSTPEEDEYEWSTQSNSHHIIKATRGQTHYPPTADVGALIGVNGDDIAGVDIQVPSPSMTFRKTFTTWTSSLMRTLLNATGKVNQYSWKGWSAEEVLFLGAVGRRKGYGPLQVTYHFLVEPNVTFPVQTVSGAVTVDKKGHDYVWYTYVKQVDETEGRTAHAIESAHVAHVYELANFSNLGIGS